MRIADQAAVYITSANRQPPSIAGIVEIAGKLRQSKGSTLFDDLYPLKIPVRIIANPDTPVPFRPLVSRLSFIGNKDGWGMYVKGHALKRLDESDYGVLRDALDDATRAASQ